MYPVLFKFSFIEARSYFILWASGLIVFIFWTRRRAVKKFGMSYADTTSVIVCLYFGAVAGAVLGHIVEKLPLYLTGQVPLRHLLIGGTSSGFSILGGCLAGFARLRNLGLSVDDFAESGAIPAAALIAIGRNGCFLEGCCLGIGIFSSERPWWGVHFPTDPVGLYRYPTQLTESFAALIILIILYILEKELSKRGIKIGGSAILAPLFLILFCLYRMIFDFYRIMGPFMAFRAAHILSFAGFFIGIGWLAKTYFKRRRENLQL